MSSFRGHFVVMHFSQIHPLFFVDIVYFYSYNCDMKLEKGEIKWKQTEKSEPQYLVSAQ